MSSLSAFYKIFYQNDTLYQLEEIKYLTEPIAIEIKLEESAETTSAVTIAMEPLVSAPPKIEPEKPKTKAPAIENFPPINHKILILIDEPKLKNIPASELVFLDNVLKAVKSSADEADIINFSLLPQTDASNLLAEKRINHFITFGVPLIKLHLDLLLIPYTPKLVEGIWFLLTDPLIVIEADRDLKRKLWLALQKMF